MKLENQVCSIGQAEKLKKLGVKQIHSLFYWTHSEKWGIMPKSSIDFSGNPTAMFTAAELVQMNGNCYGIEYSDRDNQFYRQSDNNIFVHYDTFSQACADKLINAIEREWITIDEVNNRLIEV